MIKILIKETGLPGTFEKTAEFAMRRMNQSNGRMDTTTYTRFSPTTAGQVVTFFKRLNLEPVTEISHAEFAKAAADDLVGS